MKTKSLIIILALAFSSLFFVYNYSLFFQTWFIKLAPIPEAKPIGLSINQLNDLKEISLSYNSLNNDDKTSVKLQKLNRGWQWQTDLVIDRADNQLIAKILASFHNIEIIDSFSLRELQAKNTQASQAEILNLYGINAQSIELKLQLNENHILQQFILGADSPWIGDIAPNSNIKTFYIWSPIKQKIYLMRAPSVDFLKQGPTILRDKSPFFFKNDELLKIEFSSSKENWKLEKNVSAWQARKPYICDIDPLAINQLINDISKLKITDFHPSLVNTNYASLNTSDFYTLTLTYQVNQQQQLESLTLIPVKDPNNNTSHWLAKHSQRSGYFQIKSIGSSDEPGILNLSFNLADLRSKRLLQIPAEEIQSINMIYPNGFKQVLSQPRPNNWQLTIPYSNEETLIEKPHENKLEPFLKGLLDNLTLNIVSEQEEQNLADYGLAKPSLTLEIQTKKTLYTLNIGQIQAAQDNSNAPRAHYAKWNHLNTIFKISEETYYDLVAPPYHWRSSKIWNFSPLSVKGIIREKQGGQAIILNYQSFQNVWTAQINGNDLTTHLIQNDANKLLNNLNNLTCFSWLPRQHQESRNALKNPSIKIDIILQDDEDPKREQFLTLWLAPTQPNQYYFFYGKVIGRGKPSFIIKGESVKNLIMPLFENSFDNEQLKEL